jgi:hypothetical protein
MISHKKCVKRAQGGGGATGGPGGQMPPSIYMLKYALIYMPRSGMPANIAIVKFTNALEKTTRQTPRRSFNFSSKLRAKEFDHCNKLKLFKITLQT